MFLSHNKPAPTSPKSNQQTGRWCSHRRPHAPCIENGTHNEDVNGGADLLTPNRTTVPDLLASCHHTTKRDQGRRGVEVLACCCSLGPPVAVAALSPSSRNKRQSNTKGAEWNTWLYFCTGLGWIGWVQAWPTLKIIKKITIISFALRCVQFLKKGLPEQISK